MAVTVNFWAVLVAAIVSFVIGAAWYSQALFAKVWMKSINHTPSESEKKGMGPMMVGMFVSLLITAYVLAHFAAYASATTVSGGAQLGFWVWLGFTAMYAATMVFFERKSWTWFFISTGYQLVSLVAMSIIVAVWK